MSTPRWTCFPGWLLAVGCATAPPPPPPADDVPPPVASVSAPKDDELEKAWAPPVEEKRAPSAPNVAQPPEAPDRRASFREALSEAQAALSGNRLDSARPAAEKACAEAEALGSEERAKAWALAFKVAQAEGEPGRAMQVALSWRLACGPDAVDACRAAALKSLGAVGKLKGADAKRLKALVKALQDADRCVATAERASTAAPCLAAAEKTAHQHKDELLSARVAYVRALAEKADDKKQAGLLAKAEARCDAVQCTALRRKALGKLAALALASEDLEGALKLQLKDQALATSQVEPELKLWARTLELERLCQRYDAAQGAGACRRLEKQLTGVWTFRDFSKDKPAGEGLSADQVKLVNEHYAPLLQECLSEQARRLVPPDAQRYEASWTVQNDGRVREAHLRKDLDDTPLAHCLRKQFSFWRYPRFSGELQHVEQSFLVTAVERRVSR
ncbi:MAG: hypothetical protein AB1938_18935 [Myxococcota bacterium]